MTIFFEQLDLTLAGLRRHYERGDFTPRELLAFLRQRAQQFDDRNIWIHRLDEATLEPYLQMLAANSPATLPLYGVPFAIKDNIDLAGIPTTAACPDYAYTPNDHAATVALYIQAGAIPLGKTNLDQFATGLVGVRSPPPWGACKNSFNPDYISGGSSSGSAVAVALGLASFALGTDTAGSGRVPAAFNNIVGLKPTRGVLSTRGVVPACRSLDCVSLFALTAEDLNTLFAIGAQFDEADAFARPNPAYNSGTSFGALPSQPFKFGVPRADQLQFFGDALYATAFAEAIQQLQSLGGIAREIDFAPFLDAARLLYEGPWVAERYLVVETLLREKPDALLPVIREIIAPGATKSAADAFSALYRMQHFRRVAETILHDIAFIATPTAGTHWTQQAVADNPIARNSDLGYYTNFMNLLDLSAVAVPTTILQNGLPFGITLFADHFSDLRLLSYANALHGQLKLPLGVHTQSVSQNRSDSLPQNSARQEQSHIDVIVCGAHMSGLPLNGQLTSRRATFVRTARTKKAYRFFALPGPAPKRPGLIRDRVNGYSIEVEVWRVPAAEFGSLVAVIPAPLGIGKVELDDGVWHCGFLCESFAIADAHEISQLGSWREYLRTL
ncbi:MAG: allophanate hydrolase [Spongiibacteraceae bacterium]